MNNHYYKNMLDKCPISYICGKVVRGDEKHAVDYIIEYANKTLLDIVKKDIKEIENESILNLLGIKKNEIREIEKINHKSTTLYKYISNIKDPYKINLEIIDDEFFIWMEKYVVKEDKMLEIIVDNLPIPIFYKDTNGVFLYCNEPYEKFRELDKTEIIGKQYKDILDDEDAISRYKEEDEMVITSKQTIVNEFWFERSKDSMLIEVTKLPLWNDKKDVIGVIGIVLDVTQKRATEKELEKLRLDFFSNLSHEFRTPLNLIFASVQLIDKNIPKIEKGDINTLLRYLNIIDQNGMRLLKLVNNLIDSTRIDSGCLDYMPENHNIVEFVEDICNSVVEFSNLQNIQLIFDTDEEDKIIAFDSDKMERILLNLLSNSIKYNKKDGEIDVFIKCEEEYINIGVKDTGVGIPSNKIDDIFEKFKQVDNRLTKISEGSGIGLSIVKSLVDLHNGNIFVKSEVGIGTEFIIQIPNKTIEENNTITIIKNESINMDKKIQIEFSDIY